MTSSIEYKGYNLYYKGKLELLYKEKIAIVGTRKPSKYTREITALLAQKLSKKYVIISGGALGVDKISHEYSFPNTIMVSPSSLDIIYPKTNREIIKKMQKEALIISEYEKKYMPRKYSFVQRNRIIVDLSEFVIIPEASLNSGSMRSYEWAEEFNKKVYIIPQRINESSGTNFLAKTNKAEIIWDIDEFIQKLGINSDEKILSLNEAIKKYGNKIYEMELEGEVEIKNGKVYFK